MPISNVYHRIWRIASEESTAIATKKRAPCIIYLEVIDYKYDKQIDDSMTDISSDDNIEGGIDDIGPEYWDSRWGKENRSIELPRLGLPRKAGPLLREHPTSTHPASSTAAASASLQFSIPYYTMMGGMTEMDIVNHWRFGKRDPHRGESVLDKVTNSLPLDVNRMKEKISQFRDIQGARFHELLSFHGPEEQRDHSATTNFEKQSVDCHLIKDQNDSSISLDRDSEMAAFLCNETYENTKMLPHGEDTGKEKADKARDPSPRRNQLSASICLGQWSSSTSVDKPTIPLVGEMKYPTHKDIVMYGSTSEQDGATAGCPPRWTTLPTSNSNNQKIDRSTVFPGTRRKGNTIKPPQQVVFRESWQAKEARLRKKSAFGTHPGWRLLPILVKANDDLRQEQLASQLIQRMALILARERVPVWLCPYEIIAITERGGIVECVPDTISLDSLKRNDPNFVDLNTFFHSFFGDTVEDLADAKSNFVESLAAYSIVTFLLQIKDRHNGNILLDNRGHLIHIDFGFFFLSSPGKNTGFESAPFKLTTDFVEAMGGPESYTFRTFRELCVRSFIVLRRHCMEIILLVEMLKAGNEDLPCFRGRPDDAIHGLRERFRLDLSDRACKEYVHSLIDESLENWRTNWYDRYQRLCVGVF